MGLDLAVLLANLAPILLATGGVLLLKAVVTGVLLRITGARSGTAVEVGILLASPSETTLIVLSAAAAAGLIAAETAQFWQIVTAIGLIITPILAWVGRRLARRMEQGTIAPLVEEIEAGPHAIIIGFGRVGRMVADLLAAHNKAYVGIDQDPDLVRDALENGYAASFGDALRVASLERLGLGQATAVILTMDDPVGAQKLVKKLRGAHPDLPIIARARDASHAAALYRAGASHAVPETLESSLQLAEAVLVDMGVAMGFVIASIHEKRDELRQLIMDEGELETKPRLKSGSLRRG
jgi:CPA2 family monovalent cation:H+ antiporter-2